MAVTQYIGARYVPLFYLNSDNTNEWRAGVEYEPLTIVSWNSNSYTSRIPVPPNIGYPSENPRYWVQTGQFNQQVAALTNDVAEIGERVERLEATSGQVYAPVNIMSLGAKNDGSEDVSGIINEYTNNYSLYFPEGVYRIDETVTVKNGIVGALNANTRNTPATVFVSNVESGSVFRVIDAAERDVRFERFRVDCQSKNVTAIDFVSTSHGYITVEDVTITRAHYGINIRPVVPVSRCAHINDVYIDGAEDPAVILASRGIILAAGANDSEISNVTVLGYAVGILITSANHRITSVHLYPPNGNITDAETKETYFAQSAGMDVTGNVFCDNIYIDSCLQGYVQRSGAGIIGNLIYWDDGWFASTGRTDAVIISTRAGGNVHIGRVVVGGNPATIQSITSANYPNQAVWDHLINKFTNNFYVNPSFRKFSVAGFTTKNLAEYITSDTTIGYHECCRVSVTSPSYVELSIVLGSGCVNIAIRKTGDTVIVTKLRETFTTPLWYRVDGNFIIIYTERTVAGTMRAQVYQTSGGFNGAGLCITEGCENYTFEHQSDTSGLTEITAA